MPRSTEPGKSSRATAKPPLTKAMLLPLPAATVRDLSLEYHLSLTRGWHSAGNAALLVNLAQVMYLTYFLQDAEYGQTFDRFNEAEEAMERANRRGCETD